MTRPATACRLTAEGIRTALYFGIALGRELRAVIEGALSREEAIARYAELHASHTKGFRLLLLRPAADPQDSRPVAGAGSASTRPRR